MIDKRLIIGVAHFAVTGVLLKLLGLLLPCCLISNYTCIANFLLYLYVARFTFEITKKWYLNERVTPENRTVFITGCGSGFGYNLAKRLDAVGYSVFAGCHDENGAGAKELKRSCSKRLQILEIDVTKDESVNDAVNFVKDNLGTSELWAIVNNAGILKGFEAELTDIQEFKDTFEVNTFGPVRVTKAFLPLLRQSRGRVINVTSLGGRLPLAYCTPYVMSKYAAVGLNECLRQEMEVWGIRVISIEPEAFKTGMTNREAFKNRINQTFSKVPPEVKEDYGDKYLESFKNFPECITDSVTASNIDVVIDALDDAISLEYPDSVYKPCRNICLQVAFYLIGRVPSCFFELSAKSVRILIGFPKPREAENYLRL